MSELEQAWRELLYAAHVTVSESRREFARGDLDDIDELEDAVNRVHELLKEPE